MLIVDKIDKIKRAKRKRPMIWACLGGILVVSIATNILGIYSAFRFHSMPFAEVVSTSSIAAGVTNDMELYRGYEVSAGVHFHNLWLTILIWMGFVALFQQYCQSQDLALELFARLSKNEKPVL